MFELIFSNVKPLFAKPYGIQLIKMRVSKEHERALKQNVVKIECFFSLPRRLRWTASPESKSTTATFSGHVRLKRGQSLMVLLSNPTR